MPEGMSLSFMDYQIIDEAITSFLIISPIAFDSK